MFGARNISGTRKVATCLVAAFCALNLLVERVGAQSLDDLKQQRLEAERRIKMIDEELSRLTSSKQDVAKQLTLLQRRYNSSNEVLRSIESQQRILDKRANNQTFAATILTEKLTSMQEVLKLNIRESYLLFRSLENSALLLSDSSRREYAYMLNMSQVLSDSIKSKTLQITSIKGELGEELRQISRRKDELAVLKTDEQLTFNQIKSDRERIEQLSSKLSASELKLNQEKNAREEDLRKLQDKIEELIRQEMLASRGDGAENSEEYSLSQEQLNRYSASFEQQSSGKMLPPVANAELTSKFGLIAEQSQSGVKLKNNGVNLKAKPSAQVRVVSGGEVRKVFVIGTLGTSVLVRHGKYLTVYSNLKSVGVAQGDKLELGDVIGNLGDDATLHFEVWYETSPQDPEKWIKF